MGRICLARDTVSGFHRESTLHAECYRFRSCLIDQVGTVLQIVDVNGVVKNQYECLDAWGKINWYIAPTHSGQPLSLSEATSGEAIIFSFDIRPS